MQALSSVPSPSFLSQLIGRDEGRAVLRLLSLADLGRLRSVSASLNELVTPGLIDQAALAFIRRQEGERVSVEELHHLRCHPSARTWADAGHYAAACVASLHYVVKETEAGKIDARNSTIALPGGMLRLAGTSQTRDGRAVALHSGLVGQPLVRYLVGPGQVMPLQLPDGLEPCFGTLNMGGIHVSRHFLSPPPDWWVLSSRLNACHLFHAGTRELIPLPFPPVAAPFMAALSANGRFVAVASCGQEGRVSCFDREQHSISVDRRIADRMLCQLSVGDDGCVFAGAQQRGYLFRAGDEPEPFPYGYRLNSLFQLSPDGRFLIRSGLGQSSECGDIVLEDMKDGTRCVLPRATPCRPHGCSTYPAGMAFSSLNALAAVVYYDGVIRVFDLLRKDAWGAQVAAEADFPWPGGLMQPQICFDGFDRVCTTLLGPDASSLGRHTLYLGQHGAV